MTSLFLSPQQLCPRAFTPLFTRKKHRKSSPFTFVFLSPQFNHLYCRRLSWGQARFRSPKLLLRMIISGTSMRLALTWAFIGAVVICYGVSAVDQVKHIDRDSTSLRESSSSTKVMSLSIKIATIEKSSFILGI